MGWVVMAGYGFIDAVTIHVLNNHEAKWLIKSWLQLCHTDKLSTHSQFNRI